jgi:hypothetical protein
LYQQNDILNGANARENKRHVGLKRWKEFEKIKSR